MSKSVGEKRSNFRKLHESGTFILPNPWDVGSARLLESLGFPALASTSSGYSWSRGRPDYALSLDGVLEHLSELSASVDVPINADFEGGFAREPDGVAANIERVIATGIAGVSIEDLDEKGSLYEKTLSVARIRAARRAIDDTGHDVLLVARTEGLLRDPTTVISAIDKLVAFADAGADVLYAPGVKVQADIAAMVRAVAPKSLNILVVDPRINLAEYEQLGVRRISVGGSLARVAWAAVLGASQGFLRGDLSALSTGTPAKLLNETFGLAEATED